MNAETPTYTRPQAMAALGITSPSAFHHLRRKYPSAFVVVQQGNGRKHHTLYDKAALDQFVEWRRMVSNILRYRNLVSKIPPEASIPLLESDLPTKGKQS